MVMMMGLTAAGWVGRGGRHAAAFGGTRRRRGIASLQLRQQRLHLVRQPPAAARRRRPAAQRALQARQPISIIFPPAYA